MAKKLIALTLIAAGAYAANQPGFVEGEKFEAPDDIAERMLDDKVAKVDGDAATEAKKSGKTTKARLLVNSPFGNANDVVELDAAALKDAEAAGLADSNKAAVAYALALDQNKS